MHSIAVAASCHSSFAAAGAAIAGKGSYGASCSSSGSDRRLRKRWSGVGKRTLAGRIVGEGEASSSSRIAVAPSLIMLMLMLMRVKVPLLRVGGPRVGTSALCPDGSSSSGSSSG